MPFKFKLVLFLFLISVSPIAFGQDVQMNRKLLFLEPDTTYNKKRVQLAGYTTAGLYALTITGLYQLWYKDYQQEGFHFFNDNNEWLLMDKAGHQFSSYIAGREGYNVCRWAGMNNKQATWIGGNLGWVFLASIEVLDGFSSGWGFSLGDITANTTGAALFISQQLLWKEQRMELKLSFHQTQYAQYNSELLGKSYVQELVKDYNGQTAWLSFNIQSFLKKQNDFPRWLNLAVGYGAEGMTGARQNVHMFKGGEAPAFSRYKQFYVSPDLDLTKIKTRSKALKFIFEATRFIKIPLPAIEFSTKNKLIFHPIYF
jgi:uncharacterized protein YfiM (DUF2279 family)